MTQSPSPETDRTGKFSVGIKTLAGATVLGLLLIAMLVGAGLLDSRSEPARTRFSDRPPNERAERAFERGRWDLASEALVEMLEEDPFDARSMYYLGFALHKQEKYAEAIPWYRRAMDFYPYRLACHFHLACIYAAQGDNEQALQQLQQALDGGFKTRSGLEDVAEFESLKDDITFRKLVRQEAANKKNSK
jgi:tetratricopeptide (TPR) repeat protein